MRDFTHPTGLSNLSIDRVHLSGEVQGDPKTWVRTGLLTGAWFGLSVVTARLSAAFLAAGLAVVMPRPAEAIRDLYFGYLRPEAVDRLQFAAPGQVAVGSTEGRFVLGGWPATADAPPPFLPGALQIVRGRQQNLEWANANFLRVDPAGYFWLTNPAAAGLHKKLNMGNGPILVAFTVPVCSFGAVYAQGGAFNPHYPDRRRRTSFTFFDEDGRQISRLDEKPGELIVNAAFERELRDPKIWAVTIDSEVEFALIELIAIPCAELLG